MTNNSLDPMHQFAVHNAISVNIFGKSFFLTNSAIMMLGCSIAIFLFSRSIKAYNNIKNEYNIPSKLQSFLELIAESLTDVIDHSLSHEAKKFLPFVLSIFIFILTMNFGGLIPYSFAPTSHFSITLTLALMIFILCTAILIFRHGFKVLKIFVPSGTPKLMIPLLFVLEFFSFFIRPISISVRLAANIIAGHVVLDIFAFFTIALKYFGIFTIIISSFFMMFEIFVAFLQAYIFSIFTCVYINEAMHH